MKNLYESIMDIDNNIDNIDINIFEKKLRTKGQSVEQYSKLWEDILNSVKLKPVKDPDKMLKASKGLFLRVVKSSKFSKEYIIAVQIYEAASKYPKVREFERLMFYGAYSEFQLDLRDDLEWLFDNEVYEFPKELEWLFEIKK